MDDGKWEFIGIQQQATKSCDHLTLDLQSIIIIISENSIGGVSESTKLPSSSTKLFNVN
jgi:hypothetical protein